ncbi:MAG TPA: DNA adenine methylase [Saprospiraceae bacterium]|nr:DNA adenine methylase [Saprospiraceae bacterium]
MKTPITYWGGKQNLAATIISLIPEHLTYCEPFFGGGAVFFRKGKSKVEIINDLNQFVVNFYIQVKTNFGELQKLVQSTPHSRRRWRDGLVMYEHPHLFSDVERAWAFWVLCTQGYAGKIGTWGFGTTTQCSERRVKNGRSQFAEELSERLDQVQIECNDALYLLEMRDRPTTFFYLDPPYFNSHMGHYGGYTEADFERLLQHCAALQGKFLLSSYPSSILEKYRKEQGWHQVEIEQVTTASSKRKPKTEVLTANYDITQLLESRVEAEKSTP